MIAEDRNTPHESSPPKARPRFIAIICLGVTVRLVFLLLTGDLEPHADESSYLYLAASWNHFSVYSDGGSYLWPPGYPFFLAMLLRLFGVQGVFVAKLLQVLFSAVIGWMVLLIARRLFSLRTAHLAGVIWSVHLPLIGFTHYLWPETVYLALFLPGFYLLLRWWQHEPRTHAPPGLLVAAGLLTGLSILVKEIGLWWCVPVAGLILMRARGVGLMGAVSRAALFVLAAGVVVAPWTLRNYEVYSRLVPVGATLGQNAILGLNGDYVDFDYPPRYRSEIARSNETIRDWLTVPPAPRWAPSTAGNVIDRSRENFRLGVNYAREHPGFFLRSRIKKLADWVTPLSFFVRHFGMHRYTGFPAGNLDRKLMISGAVFVPILVMVGVIGGLFTTVARRAGWLLMLATLVYFATASSLIVAMSRYRTPLVPFLIVLAAAFWNRAEKRSWTRGRLMACVGAWTVLAALWGINAAEVWTMIRVIW